MIKTDITLIAINNIKKLYFNVPIGLGIIYEYLVKHNYKPKCVNYFINLDYEDYTLEYGGYIPELINLPEILQILKNHKDNKEDLLNNIIELNNNQIKNLRNLEKSINKLHIKDNAVFGFSVFSLSFLYSVYCALLIRKKNPKVRIVFGGYHITLSKNVRDFILKSGITDIAVIGDGCEPMLKIVKGKILKGIIVGNFEKNVTWPLDYYARLSYTNNRYMTMASVGCPFKCYFCASKRKHVLYDLGQFEQYLKRLLKKIKIESFHLVDDEINSSIGRANRICRIMRRIDVPWSCFLSPTNINKELAINLKKSNCIRVFVGADSFYNPRLRYINKPTTERQNLKAISLLAKQGLKISMSLIVGFPNESKNETKHNIKIYHNLRKRFDEQIFICFSIFKLYPGSYFYHHAIDHGIKFSYWEKKYQKFIPELGNIIKLTPKQFHIPNTNRGGAIKLMEEFNNYLPRNLTDPDYKEVSLVE